MSSTSHYDQALLAAAPPATRAQLQEGYNPNLLYSARRQQGVLPLTPLLQGDSEQGYASKEYLGNVALPVPFWRSTKGKAVMFVATVVVIAAVVGGAVGGTVGKKNGAASSSNNSQQQAGHKSATQDISPMSADGPNSSTRPTASATTTATTALPVVSSIKTQGVEGVTPNHSFAIPPTTGTTQELTPDDGFAIPPTTGTTQGLTPDDGFAIPPTTNTTQGTTPNQGFAVPLPLARRRDKQTPNQGFGIPRVNPLLQDVR